ncbi:MAG: helix-turn-helix transcriptional regulator [Actinomycetota bacterium]|nr:helix-turn-helix transcriptional regulator [Actinomycetota bacterium]
MKDREKRGVYMIGVAARLAGLHPQTLRMYEAKEIISPSRSDGKTRLYSDEDIEMLKYVQRLTSDLGINLSGVKMIMNLNDQIEEMDKKMEEMKRGMDEFKNEMVKEIDSVHRSYRRDIVVFPKGSMVKRDEGR